MLDHVQDARPALTLDEHVAVTDGLDIVELHRLSADPTREPPYERTEYQPELGGEGNVGRHAHKDAQR